MLSIALALPYGYNGCRGFLPDNCKPGEALIIPLDAKRMVGTFRDGIEIPLRPFFGSMGVAPPPSSGRISSNPPWIHAGNLDNKELVAGTTLSFLFTCRGLFEVGDGHAAQERRRSGPDGDRNLAARPPSTDRPQRHEAFLAACGDVRLLHQHGHR